jgi:NAD(P)H-dependent flavin oxidoreductase YrpB (nitropropane dioxygenase family)
MRTRPCDMFDIEFPIFAFSHCRDVVAAVSKAGGMGVLGALYFTPEQLEIELAWIDEHVEGKPYGVDIVIPAKYEGASIEAGVLEQELEKQIPEGHKRFVEDVLDRYNVPKLPPDDAPPRALLGWTDATARPQLEVAFKHPIALLVNALGPPPPDIVDHAHGQGIKVAALVGRADQALRQKEVGVDIIVAQGTEAGGHTGEISTFVLLPDVVEAVAPTPVLGAGGIGTGRQMAAALALGAEGVWTGSIWLTVAEADTSPMIRDKLLAASSRDTVRSRSMTGKPARQLRTAWTDAWEDPDNPDPLPMPLQWMLTAEAQHRIFRYQPRELVGMPVGQIVGRMNRVRPARDVIYDMVEECAATIDQMRALLQNL